MLKENGKSKSKKTKIKCDKCKQRFDLEQDEIIKIDKISYTECIYCGTQIILKNN